MSYIPRAGVRDVHLNYDFIPRTKPNWLSAALQIWNGLPDGAQKWVSEKIGNIGKDKDGESIRSIAEKGRESRGDTFLFEPRSLIDFMPEAGLMDTDAEDETNDRIETEDEYDNRQYQGKSGDKPKDETDGRIDTEIAKALVANGEFDSFEKALDYVHTGSRGGNNELEQYGK